MYNKTTSFNQTKYYDIVSQSEIQADYEFTLYETLHKSSSTLMHFNRTIYVQSVYGIIALMIAESPHHKIEQYILHGIVAIHPGMHFYLLKITDDAKAGLYRAAYDHPQYYQSNHPIMINEVKESFFLPQIYASYYQIKKAPYYYDFERHYFWEMTVVNSGVLQTNIDGINYELHKNDLIFYGPLQKHNQRIEDDMCTYVTIMFDCYPIHRTLLNKIFHLDQMQSRLMEDIVRYTDNEYDEYNNELFINQLKELIILLLRQDPKEIPQHHHTTTMRFNFENDLLNRILEHIHNNIEGGLRVIDLCQYFAISRATIQSIFNNNLEMTPKQYINDVRLKQAKVLINESKYTLSEIANRLGYSSIHYFSRAFKEEFNTTPSEYAKSLVKK